MFLACRLAVKTTLKFVFQRIGTNNPTPMSRCNNKNKSSQRMFYQAGWPSGLRRCVQVAVSSDAGVRIPLLSAVFVLACRLAVKTSLKFVFQHIGTNNPTLISRCNNKNESSQENVSSGRMAERSKALRSGRSIFGCVGSNPTPVNSFCF